jgi:hypothetical protein
LKPRHAAGGPNGFRLTRIREVRVMEKGMVLLPDKEAIYQSGGSSW